MENYFKHDHCATDFTTMADVNETIRRKRWKPTDMDGITHRYAEHGYPFRFLALEIKTNGEQMKDGQYGMLRDMARQPNWTVVIVHNRYSDPVGGRRKFDPIYYDLLLPDGTFADPVVCGLTAFAERYATWCLSHAGAQTAFLP